MSEEKPAAPTKPARSPVEKAIVWGVIGIGILVIAVEANAHLAHGAALAKLQAQLDETVNKESGMRKSHVDQIVGNKIPETQKLAFLETSMAASRVDIYTYPALLRSRKLYIYYGIDGKQPGQEAEVMEVLTSVAPTAEQVHARVVHLEGKSGGSGEARAGGPGGPGSGTGGGMGGGQRRRRGGDAKEGRPGAEVEATNPDADATSKEETKPVDDAKPADEAKPDEAKPADEAKPDEAKPANAKAEEIKDAEIEPKKE